MIVNPNNGQYYVKKKKGKEAVPALMVYPQAYPNQYVAQPQPMYQMSTQPYGMMQPIPQATPQPMVVPVGSPQYVPIGPPVMMAQPVATPKPKPAVKPVKKQPRKPDKIIIIQKQPRPQEDDCCNIF